MKVEDYRDLLIEIYEEVYRCLSHLEYSYDQVQSINIEKADQNNNELEKLEAYTARFSRLSDILTQKFLRTILILLREDQPTFIDRANKLKQLEIIPSAELLITIKDLRNSILHEYWIDQIKENFKHSIELGENLIETTTMAVSYCKERSWLSER